MEKYEKMKTSGAISKACKLVAMQRTILIDIVYKVFVSLHLQFNRYAVFPSHYLAFLAYLAGVGQRP